MYSLSVVPRLNCLGNTVGPYGSSEGPFYILKGPRYMKYKQSS